MGSMKGGLEIGRLRRIHFFSSFAEEELQGIIGKLRIKRFVKGQTILYEQDTNEYMYIILNGKVKVVQTTREGKEMLIAFHEEGESFGELSLIDGKTSPARIIAMEDSAVCIISKKDFFFLINTQEKIRDNLLLMLCSRLRESWDKIELLNLKNAAQRLKILFFTLCPKYGEKTSDGLTLNIRLTHHELASMSGLTREAVTRVLDKWKKRAN